MWQWNDEITTELRQMWADGLTGSTICQIFHEKYGKSPSRSAVMGKVCRSEGFTKRKKFHGTVKVKSTKPRGKYKPRAKYLSIFDRPEPQLLPDSPALIGSNPGTLPTLLPHHCRWPVDGAGIDALFCRDTKFKHHPYCLAHCRMAYRPAPQRQAA